MVPGLSSFREWFSDFTDQYVIIGGAACDIYYDKKYVRKHVKVQTFL